MASQRALIIDDNRMLAATVADILSESGFEVDVAYSGLDGLIMWRERPADLVIVDVDLPDIGGLKIARRLLRRAVECHLVVMSAEDPQRLLPLIEELGATFLAKPFTPSHLVATVRLVVQQRTARRVLSAGQGRGARRLLGSRRPPALLQHSRPGPKDH